MNSTDSVKVQYFQLNLWASYVHDPSKTELASELRLLQLFQ